MANRMPAEIQGGMSIGVGKRETVPVRRRWGTAEQAAIMRTVTSDALCTRYEALLEISDAIASYQSLPVLFPILAAKLAAQQHAERRAELEALGGERTDNAWGNQIRSYVLAPYQMVKDLRTDVETGNVDAVLDGDLDPFMEAELRRRRAADVAAR